MIKDILRQLFSLDSYDKTHIKLTILGIKIKFPKYQYRQLKKQNEYYFYKRLKADIKSLPPATGIIRQIQLANIILLDELDYVCRKNNIPYWLDGGTLLGAVRHKGFIPWDDDIDVGMMIDDYDRIIDIFNKNTRDENIYAVLCRNKIRPDIMLVKIKHKSCPHLFVDIFPFYYYGTKISTTEQIIKTKEIKQIRKRYRKQLISAKNIKELNNLYKNIMREEIIPNINPNNIENTDLVWGIDYNHSWKNWFTNYNVIFPLKPIVFEGKEYMGMNNPDAFLSRVYGKYMDYPNKITCGHSMYKCGYEELEIIRLLALQKYWNVEAK